MANQENNPVQYITEDDVKLIVARYGFPSDDTIIESYVVKNASDSKILGFLGEYFKLKITFVCKNEQKQLSLFIKAISRTNAAKANFVIDTPMYDNELKYYTFINGDMKIPDLKPWTAKFVIAFDGVAVFDDLYALNYAMRNKYTKFDQQHTLQALNTLVRFHASTFIYEEKRSKKLQREYRVNEDYGQIVSIYSENDPWFSQCRDGALEAVKQFSKYSEDKEALTIIESRWRTVYNSILSLSETSLEHRRVLSHGDLWNNNLLFHYKTLEDGSLEPDDCVLVDFQLVDLQPPAADVMVLLHCNLEPQYRKDSMGFFLDYYYNELKTIFSTYDINIQDILKKDNFMESAELYNRWGLIVCASIAQVFWPEDHLVYEMFDDSAQFLKIMAEDKGNFIKKIMQKSDNYKKVLMGMFEEIIDEYILTDQ